ncbi:hypothetical protein ncot_08630 [Nocardioides sp. JQ2195]|nr:hypothetical protein ncot_08630 [Nocardioides sp. JQ2195]
MKVAEFPESILVGGLFSATPFRLASLLLLTLLAQGLLGRSHHRAADASTEAS